MRSRLNPNDRAVSSDGGCVKQITMDYETYYAELEGARLEGAAMTTKLLASVKEIFKGLHSHDGMEHEKSMLELNYFINGLEKRFD